MNGLRLWNQKKGNLGNDFVSESKHLAKQGVISYLNLNRILKRKTMKVALTQTEEIPVDLSHFQELAMRFALRKQQLCFQGDFKIQKYFSYFRNKGVLFDEEDQQLMQLFKLYNESLEKHLFYERVKENLEEVNPNINKLLDKALKRVQTKLFSEPEGDKEKENLNPHAKELGFEGIKTQDLRLDIRSKETTPKGFH